MDKKKIVFLDIDGTLISGLTAPSERTVEAVRSARQRGIRYFCAREGICRSLARIFWM